MSIPHFSGFFSAHKSATQYSNPTTYNEIVEATQTEQNAPRIQALQSNTKLKKTSKNPQTKDEYIKAYAPTIRKQGGNDYKSLKFNLGPIGDQSTAGFVDASLTRAEAIENALKADNIVDQPDNAIVHSKYISPRFLMHPNGGLAKYVAAKHAFATNADLPRLSDRVSIKLLDNGSLRIQIAGKHFFSSKLHNEKLPLPQGEDVDIAQFVNDGIRRAKNLAAGHGIPLKQPLPQGGEQHDDEHHD